MQKNLEEETRSEDIDLGSFFARLGQRWLLVVLLILAGAVVGYLCARLAPPRYVASTTLVPQLTTINSQILATLSETSGRRRRELGWGPEMLYGQILRSERILDAVLAGELALAQAGQSSTLFSVYGVAGQAGVDTPAAEDLALVKSRLSEEAIHYQRDPMTEFMRLSISLPSQPEVAARIANRLVEELDRYFWELSSQRADYRQRMLTERLGRLERELTAAEAGRPDGDPGSYAADVEALRNVWILTRTLLETLQAHEYESFKPINVLDPARPPSGPVYRDRRSAGLLGGVCGLLLALILIQVQLFRPRRSS